MSNENRLCPVTDIECTTPSFCPHACNYDLGDGGAVPVSFIRKVNSKPYRWRMALLVWVVIAVIGWGAIYYGPWIPSGISLRP